MLANMAMNVWWISHGGVTLDNVYQNIYINILDYYYKLRHNQANKDILNKYNNNNKSLYYPG